MENYATTGRATGSRRRGRDRSQNPHRNRDFWQNSGQNRQWEEAHVQNSGRGRSFRDPATPYSAAPRGNGGDGGRGYGGRGRGWRGGAYYVPQQPNSESAATTASPVWWLLFAFATIGILFLVINGRFNEIGDFLKVVAALKNLMLSDEAPATHLSFRFWFTRIIIFLL